MGRRDRAWVGGAVILAAAVAVAVSCTHAASGSTLPPRESLPPAQRFLVTGIIDGDTLRVALDGQEETVRLVGINAPEDGECWAREATAALGVILAEGEVLLERDVSDRDPYGRLLRYVTTVAGEDAGGTLIDGGHAIARSYPPDVARQAGYRQRQLAAREAGRGLWARDACGEGAAAGLDATSVGIEVHFDAAGDDSLNLNDEWVRFTNLSVGSLDLAGWQVRDESSSHRYRFLDLVLPEGAAVTLRSGCGVDTTTDRYWCVSGSAVWNNAGDTVFLLDPAGNIVTQLGYPLPAREPSVPSPRA